MVVIAVVGGTGNVGKTLVDALKESAEHEVIVLARKVPEGENAIPVFAVDYNNVEQIVKTLEDNNVHTVISTIALFDPPAAQAEQNLVAAAAKAPSVKRFIASNWGLASPDDESLRIPPNIFREQTVESLRKTDLEWTQIHNGFFLDYFGIPHVETYITPLGFAVDIAHRTAAIPGDAGDVNITFTYTKDLAKFVVAALGLPKWGQVMHCYGDNASLNELIKIAEEITGSKFTITSDPVEKLQRREVTELPSHPQLYPYIPKEMLGAFLAAFGLWTVNDIMGLPKEGSLNEQFPEIKTTSVRELLSVWKGK